MTVLARLASLAAAASVLSASALESERRSPARRGIVPDAVSYVLVDANTGKVLAAEWRDRDAPVALGSLLKPFTALAYAHSYGFQYPNLTCSGGDSCWSPRGHGPLGMREAIAESCNAYFLALAKNLDLDRISSLSRRYGLQPPLPPSSEDTWIGLGPGWPQTPLALINAFRELSLRGSHPGVRQLLQGLRLAAGEGTAHGLRAGLGDVPALGKTGTSPCNHAPDGDGDGSVIALFPADQPRYVFLLRAHGVTGKVAAQWAGERLAGLLGAAPLGSAL